MADYFTPTVVQPTIPNSAMTPLERLLLTHIFDAEPDGDGLYFSSDEGPSDMLSLKRGELDAALALSQYAPESSAFIYIMGQLAEREGADEDIDLDVSGTSWEFFFQDIVRRSVTLAHVTVVSSFTCSKMRPDGFGGMAVLITADAVKGKSTHDFLSDLQNESEYVAAQNTVHALLALDESNIRPRISTLIAANGNLTPLAAEAVSDADIHAACLATKAATDLWAEQETSEIKAAMRAIHIAEQRLPRR